MRDDRDRIVITGLGVVAPSGLGHEPLWRAALEQRCFLGPISRFDASRYRARLAGEATDFDAERLGIDRRIVNQTDRSAQMGMVASTLAVRDAGIDLAAVDRAEVGMYFANVFGGMEFAEPELFAQTWLGPSRVSAYQAIAWFYAAAQGQWSLGNDVRGFAKSIVGDRAGGLQALLLGANAVRQGHCTWILAGGFEAPLVPYAYAIHEATGALLPDGDPASYRPFDRRAAGMTLAEGACVVVMESLTSARSRGASVYAELAGGAMNIDAGEPGSGLVDCLVAALSDAGAQPSEVTHLLPEGSAVPSWDRAEALAIHKVFAEYGLPAVALPKSAIGHALAAAGPLDVAWAALMLRHGCVAGARPPESPIGDVPLRFARDGEALRGGAIACIGSGWQGMHAALVLRPSGGAT